MGLKENIKKYRLLNNFTLDDVAKKVGVTLQTIQKYEKGTISNIPHDKIEKLSEIFGIAPSELMGWDDSELTLDITENRMKQHIHSSTYECLNKNINNLACDLKNILQLIILDLKDADINDITGEIKFHFTYKLYNDILYEMFNELKTNLYATITNNFFTDDDYKQYYFDSDMVKNEIEEHSSSIEYFLIKIITNFLKNELINVLKSFNFVKIVLIEDQEIKSIIEETFKDESKLNSMVCDLSHHIKQELFEDIRLLIISDIYYSLNELGQQKISEYVEDLGENEKYRKGMQL